MNHPPDNSGNLTKLQLLIVLCCGALFGFGLSMSGMISPEIILAFLRGVDMGLLLVMAGAVFITLLTYQLLPRIRSQPLLGGVFERHPSVYNRRTALGAALFGIGWGLCGVCPGPAIAGLGAGNGSLLFALIGIATGAYLQGITASSQPSASSQGDQQ